MNPRIFVIVGLLILFVLVLWAVLESRGRAQQECWPAQDDVLNTIRNIEVIRVESVRQTEILKELRAASRGKK